MLAHEAFVLCHGYHRISDRVRLPPPHIVGETVAIHAANFRAKQQRSDQRLSTAMLQVCQKLQSINKALSFTTDDIEVCRGIVATAVIDSYDRYYDEKWDEYKYDYVFRDVRVLPNRLKYPAVCGDWFLVQVATERKILGMLERQK